MADEVSVASFEIQFEKLSGFLEKYGTQMDALAKMQDQLGSAASKFWNTQQDQDEGDKERLRRLRDSESLWQQMARSSQSMRNNVLDIGGALLKWGSLFTGGALFGSLFGIDRLAHSIGDTRTASMGLSMSPGALQAFNNRFSKVIPDTQGFLSSILTMETDLSKQIPWQGMFGGRPMSGDVLKDSLAYLQGLRNFFHDKPLSQIGMYAQAYQVPQDMQTILRAVKMPQAEWSAMFANFNRDQGKFGLNDKAAKAWQDLSQQFEYTATLLKDQFAVALKPLAPELGKLSGAFGNAVAAFLKSPAVESAITGLSNWFDKFAKTLDASALQDKLAKFSVSIGDLGDLIHTVAHPYDTLTDWVGGEFQKFHDWVSPSAASVSAGPDAFRDYLGRLDARFNLPDGLLSKVWQAESGGALYPSMSKKGAIGAFQLMPATAAQYGANPFDPTQSANAAATYLQDLFKKYGDMQKALAAYDYGPGNLDKMIAQHPKDWLGYVPTETRDYVSKITGPKSDTRRALFSFPRGSSTPQNSESLFAPQGTGVTINIITPPGHSAAISLSQLGGR